MHKKAFTEKSEIQENIKDSSVKEASSSSVDSGDTELSKEEVSDSIIKNREKTTDTLNNKERKEELKKFIGMLSRLIEEVDKSIKFEWDTDRLKKIKRIQDMLGDDELRDLTRKYGTSLIITKEFFRKINKLSAKENEDKEKVSESLVNYIANKEGFRGDKFIDDMFYIFKGIEDRGVDKTIKKSINPESLRVHTKLKLGMERYLRDMAGLEPEKRINLEDMKVDLKELGFYNEEDEDVLMRVVNKAVITCSSALKKDVVIHYGDMAKGCLEQIMTVKMYRLLRDGNLKKMKNNLYILFYHLLDHQRDIGRKGVVEIDRNKSTSTYEIDSENKDDPMATTEELIYLAIRLFTNLASYKVSLINSRPN